MIKNALLMRRDRLIEIRNQAERDVATAPEGWLDISRSQGNTQYRRKLSDGSLQYLGKNQMPLALSLAQKSYAKKIIHAADKELRLISRLLADPLLDGGFPASDICSSEFPSLERVFDEMLDARKNLVRPYIVPSSEFIQDWGSDVIDTESIFGQGLIFHTEKGEQVRSKSEVIIADKLFRAGIPYKYEQPLTVDDSTFYPDFTILIPRSRRELIWEHFGMMDDTEYCNKCMRKLRTYSRNGIFPGNGMIATFETSATPLSTQQIDAIVESIQSNTWCSQIFEYRPRRI